MSKKLFDDAVEVDIDYPEVKDSSISSILNHINWIENELSGDWGALALYSDYSGHIEGDRSFSFDSLDDCKGKLMSFTANIFSWEKEELSIDIKDFKGYTVATIEEKMIDESEWRFDGLWLLHDGYMKNKTDTKGLLEFLVNNNILPKGSTLTIERE